MRSRSRSAILLALLAAGCNCAKQPGPTPLVEGASRDVEVASTDDGFLYARLSARPAPVPARFDAPLPASVESFRGEWAEDRPPRAYVRDQLCLGDAAMGDRLATAVDAASAAGATAEELASTYGRMVEHCATPAFCEWAQAQASDDERTEAFRAVVWTGLARCPAPIVEAVIGRPGVPPSALVRFHRGRVYAQLGGRPLPIPEGLVDAVRALVQVEGGYDAEHEASVAIDTLASMEGGAAAIVALDAELVAQRDRIGMGLWNATDPRLRRLFDAACARTPTEHRCRRPRAEDDGGEEESAEAPTPDALVRDSGFDARAYLAEHPSEREAILGALERCGREGDYRAARCLASLARLDWARARALATAAPPEEGRAGEVRRTLRTYETPEALGARLVEIGLLRSAPSETAITVEDALSIAGALHGFDTETGQFPNEHDSLLRELAALAPEALPGVRFLEIAPGSSGAGLALGDGTSLRPDSIGDEEDLGDEDEGPYTLVAYLDGQEFRAEAENLGDWYDVGTVVGMLNELARRRRDATRWQVLPTGDQTATVVAAPGPAIRRAIREGLLEGEDADRARQDGRELERRAFEALGR